MSLPPTHLTTAFATTHPDVTSAIIGPRTADHLEDLLAGAETTLDDAVLNRIDETVPPGTTLSPLDVAHTPPAITRPALRRRASNKRAAA
ncbi:MAG: aldo/keto reductase [Umezawaea sp.]